MDGDFNLYLDFKPIRGSKSRIVKYCEAGVLN